jgi:hypothetical protein
MAQHVMQIAKLVGDEESGDVGCGMWVRAIMYSS